MQQCFALFIFTIFLGKEQYISFLGELSYNSTSWDKSFYRVKKFFLFFIVLSFIIGNIIDITNPKPGFSHYVYIINGIYIGLSCLWIILYLFKLISLYNTGILAIYSLLINILLSLAISSQEPDYEIYYMREMMILGILLIPTGFILHKKHVLVFGGSIFILYTGISFFTESPFLHDNYFILLTALFGYTFWVYFILLTLENWALKQEGLVQSLEKKNQAFDNKQKELETINRTKDRIFSVIAHDLKNPLNSIIGFSDLLIAKRKNIDDEKVDRYLKIINHSANESEALLDNIFNWATSQTNDISFKPVKVDTQKLVEEFFRYFKPNCDTKDIVLKSNIISPQYVYADLNMLNTILRNLIHNAIKFTARKGEILVSIEKRKNETLFTVTDNGIGMEKDFIKSLFDQKIHVRNQGTEKEQGTGLGLIICKEFIEHHGGKIWLDSVLNKGTSFYFSIPDISQKA